MFVWLDVEGCSIGEVLLVVEQMRNKKLEDITALEFDV